MNPSPAPPGYHVYVLRVWQENAATPLRPAIWRFSLEDPQTRERRGYKSLEALVAFLVDLLATGMPSGKE